MKIIQLFCDGSALGNPGPGGWCAILRYKQTEKVLSGGAPHTTNNRMELSALNEGLKALKTPCQIALYSDSTYVCDGISKWLSSWIARGFARVKNVDLWQEFLVLSAPHRITPHWIKGHAGHPENERCDQRARAEALYYKTQSKGVVC
ncbi:ribonuclease HI [Helicobacter cynogastricus]|uniref:ribonuclease HI n=1 Tax=Helicobacter cynogastricus TaxID=329937 RepID=UPI000CF0978B|nr:ribonuclease HI [Helicobacter cynogastricus]